LPLSSIANTEMELTVMSSNDARKRALFSFRSSLRIARRS
jgi:hypothetical protein